MNTNQQTDDLGPLVQLQAFADFETKYHPSSRPGQKHIAQWAAEEIEMLMMEIKRLKTENAMLYGQLDANEELRKCRD